MPSLVGTVGIHWCPHPSRVLLLEVPPFRLFDRRGTAGAYHGGRDYVLHLGGLQKLRPQRSLGHVEPMGVVARGHQHTATTGPTTWH